MKNRGFTLVELLVVIAIIALLVGLLLPALAKAQKSARETKDATQIKQIHQAMLSFASKDKAGRLPIPGLIRRCVIAGNPPQPGTEDYSQNTTRNLYSSMIAADYFKPDICIGATETNPVVVEKGKPGATTNAPYDYTQYNPGLNPPTYWDSTFMDSIGGVPATSVCNVSYAHLALIGLRKDAQWRNTQDSTRPLFSTRGPILTATGAWETTGANTTAKSYALGLVGPKQDWWGNIVYADNHVDLAKNFYPEGVNFECANSGNIKDHIFITESPAFQAANCLKHGCTATCGGAAAPGATILKSSGDTWLGFFPNTISGCLIGAQAYDAAAN